MPIKKASNDLIRKEMEIAGGVPRSKYIGLHTAIKKGSTPAAPRSPEPASAKPFAKPLSPRRKP